MRQQRLHRPHPPATTSSPGWSAIRRGTFTPSRAGRGCLKVAARRQAGHGAGDRVPQCRRREPFARRRAHRSELGGGLDSGVDDLRSPARGPLRLRRAEGGPASGPAAGLSAARTGQLQRRPDLGDERGWGPLQGQLLHFSFGTGTHVPGPARASRRPAAGRRGAAARRFPLGRPPRAVPSRGWPALRLGNGGVGNLHAGRRLLPARPLHRATRCSSRSLPTCTRTACSSRSAGPWTARSPPIPRATSPRRGTTATAPPTARRSCRRGTPGLPGHDRLAIRSATVLEDGRTLFLELPDLQPVSQLQLHLRVDSAPRRTTCSSPSTSWHRPSAGSPATGRRGEDDRGAPDPGRPGDDGQGRPEPVAQDRSRRRARSGSRRGRT